MQASNINFKCLIIWTNFLCLNDVKLMEVGCIYKSSTWCITTDHTLMDDHVAQPSVIHSKKKKKKLDGLSP